VEKDAIIDGSKLRTGDTLVGLASSGPHSNGYSLIRKILEVSGSRLDDTLDDLSLAEWLLAPTRIYVKPLLSLFSAIDVHALAHITGGGLIENLPRVMPQDTCARLDTGAWQRPVIFDWLQQTGHISATEMYRTFNCGIGMVICIDPADVQRTLEHLAEHGEDARIIGQIEPGKGAPAAILED
jgi:phosphoribosylformylglycinamidine cyclo-ligase